MLRVCLVQSPWSVNKTPIVPLPLLVLGARLEEIGREGLELDFDLVDLDFALKRGELDDSSAFFDAAADLLDPENTDVFLMTTHGPNDSIVVQIAERLKSRNPRCLIVLGGVIATLNARQYVASFPWIDVVIKGEGEPALKALLEAARSDRDLSGVPSAVFVRAGKIVDNERVYLQGDRFLAPIVVQRNSVCRAGPHKLL